MNDTSDSAQAGESDGKTEPEGTSDDSAASAGSESPEEGAAAMDAAEDATKD